MKILVTGACGSLMREVIPRLVERGHHVRGIDNFMRYGREVPPADIEFMEGDLTDPAVVRRALGGMDGVIQAAAQIYGVAGFHRNSADILQRDTLLHGLILRTALNLGVGRVVYISSSMVYERVGEVAQESDLADAPTPFTGYGLSKLMGERLSQAFADQYGLQYTIWRPFNIIGLHETAAGYDPGVCHVFADFIQRIVIERQNPMLILGTGSQIRSFTWVGDVADAVAAHSFSAQTVNQDFNLGNPQPTTMTELARRIYRLYHDMTGSRVVGPLEFIHKPAFKDDVQVRIPDISKAQQVLGWAPTLDLDEMLRRCLAATLPGVAVPAE